MKDLGDYTVMDLNRVLGITEIQCPYCPKTLQVTSDLRETGKTLKAHAATHKDSRQVEEVLVSRAMTEIVRGRR